MERVLGSYIFLIITYRVLVAILNTFLELGRPWYLGQYGLWDRPKRPVLANSVTPYHGFSRKLNFNQEIKENYPIYGMIMKKGVVELDNSELWFFKHIST